MLDKINKLIITAKKEKNRIQANALILLKSALQSNLKAKKPTKEIDVIRSHVKVLEKGAQAFVKTDKYTDLLLEIETVKALLPKELDPEVVKEEVIKYLAANPVLDKKGIGKAMKDLKNKLGAHNGRLISSNVMSLAKI